MMKLELTGPGYTLRFLSDPHDGEIAISITGLHRNADCVLSSVQIRILQAHVDELVKRMDET